MLLQCERCKPHTYQDQKYGPKRRVHTHLKVTDKNAPKFRCTVCENVRGK